MQRVSACNVSCECLIQTYDTSNQSSTIFTNEYVFNYPIPSSIDENTRVPIYIKQYIKIQCQNINFDSIATKRHFWGTYYVQNTTLILFPR